MDEGERTGGVREVERESLTWGLGTFGMAPKWWGGTEERDEVEIGGLVILGILNVPKGGVETGAVVVGEKAGGGGMIGEEAVVGGENIGGGGIMGGGEGDREGWGICWGLRDNFWSLTSTDPKLTPG